MEHRHSEYWRLVAGLRSTQIWIWPPCKSTRPVWPRAFFCHSTQWQMGEMLHSRLCKEEVLCMRSVWSARHRAHCRAGLGADSSISYVSPIRPHRCAQTDSGDWASTFNACALASVVSSFTPSHVRLLAAPSRPAQPAFRSNRAHG